MALIRCPSCKLDTSDSLPTCPNCLAPLGSSGHAAHWNPAIHGTASQAPITSATISSGGQQGLGSSVLKSVPLPVWVILAGVALVAVPFVLPLILVALVWSAMAKRRGNRERSIGGEVFDIVLREARDMAKSRGEGRPLDRLKEIEQLLRAKRDA